MYKTEKEYKEACEELKRHIEDGVIPPHSIKDATFCIVSEMWKSEWWQQKRTNLITRV